MARIVVGIDDSPAATAALRWALEEARLRRATLEIVHTWVFPAFGELPGGMVDTLVAGLLLGSVAQQCIHHARCPVVVVREERHP
jgi:nucleotide-binding universal stress UspA family protein